MRWSSHKNSVLHPVVLYPCEETCNVPPVDARCVLIRRALFMMMLNPFERVTVFLQHASMLHRYSFSPCRPAWTMNWVDRLRTSADKRMWSGRRAVVMRTGRMAELLGVKLGFPRSRCRAVVSEGLCVRLYVHFVCVYVYMCMCVCVRT